MYNTITANKSGGCGRLIAYLEKEDSLSKGFAEYLDKESRFEPGHFFNNDSRVIDTEQVIVGIDKNCKGLKRDESRFFSLTINPSQRELQHLEKLANQQIQKMEIGGITSDLFGSVEQIREALVKDMLQQYAVNNMDRYAENFGRDKIRSSRDLVWFGRVEKDRYWKYTAAEVKHNRNIDSKIRKELKHTPSPSRDKNVERLKKTYILESDVRHGGKPIPIQEMMPKSGINYHIHIIVSRRDKEQKMSLSPLAKARSNNQHLINGQECQIGFNRDKFTQIIENQFDGNFSYSRYFSESYCGRKLLKENPMEYKVKEVEYNAQRAITEQQQRKALQKEYGSSDTRSFNGSDQVFDAGNKFANSAGLNYINDSLRPYQQSVSTAYKGIRLLTSQRSSSQQATRLGKSMAHNFAKGAGLGAVSNPYSLIFEVGKQLTTTMSRGL